MWNTLLGAILIASSLLLMRFQTAPSIIMYYKQKSDLGFAFRLVVITLTVWWILTQFNL